VRQALEEAYVLAQQWGYEQVFSHEDVTQLLAQNEELASCHELAGRLAGTRSPWAARIAYAALQDRRGQFPTLDTQEQFLDALRGTSPDEHANAGMVAFDRSLLRERWVATSTRPPDETTSFRELTVPLSPRSAQFLRTALARVASWTEEPLPGNASCCWYQEIADELDLALLLRLTSSWLIETHPQAAIRLYCWVYGEVAPQETDSPRIYRLSLEYKDAPLDGPPTRDLRVLCAERATGEQQALEAAWQAYLVSWLTWSEVQCAPLAQGLQVFWLLQGGRS
jgi:hypothetical protein